MDNPLASVIVVIFVLLLILVVSLNIHDKLTKKPPIKKSIIVKKPVAPPKPVDNNLTDTSNLLKAAF